MRPSTALEVHSGTILVERRSKTLIAEYCLAHSVGDATERAYARGDMLEKRFDMMNIWADYVTSELSRGPSKATTV